MDLLRDKVRPLYFRYLAAAFGSTFISSIYSIVDMAVVGQYHSPEGTAALAVYGVIVNISTFVQCCGYSVGLALSGGLILILPSLLGADALWLAMPITEAVTICAALVLMKAARRD